MATWLTPTYYHLPRIHPFSAECTDGLQAGTITILASTAFPTANASILWPVYIRRTLVITKFTILIGATNTGNVDAGLYDANINALIVSAGSTAAGTANTEQVLDITDKTVPPGKYWMAVGASGTGLAMVASTLGAVALRNAGIMKATSNFPLAANPTVAGAVDAFLPMASIMRFPRTI